MLLVHHQRVGFHRRCRIVQGVRVLRRFTLQLTLVRQRTGTAVAEKSIMAYKLDVMTGVARFDAIHTDCIAIGGIARMAAVEIMHRERGVGRDFVQTLPARYRLLHLVLVVKYLVPADDRLHAAGQTQPTELVVEDLIVLERRGRIVREIGRAHV